MVTTRRALILASKSPRRHELLKSMGLDFQVRLEEVDESYPADLDPSKVAQYISKKKAGAFSPGQNELILTADTIVVLDKNILGKPENEGHAREMLRKLSGKTHQVYTGVTLRTTGTITSFSDKTDVTFREVTDGEIAHYVDNFNPFDKAGSYGVQDWWGITVVSRIEGSYTNVMGLPTEKLYRELHNLMSI